MGVVLFCGGVVLWVVAFVVFVGALMVLFVDAGVLRGVGWGLVGVLLRGVGWVSWWWCSMVARGHTYLHFSLRSALCTTHYAYFTPK